MDMVDASDFEVSPWNLNDNHSYFTSKNRVIRDLISVIKGLAPKPRGLLERFKQGKPYWLMTEE